ncbi:diguanylate cyclase [Anaerosporomusa subterranea]|uniref:Diguanylate cyclase n=1 Tax=Anaerosporomusa subterranea TaxID=1794912 RepID=A0A154BP16_ANASB|nr:sigma 54-interacting transcriptional regulator [Anaerosporomusa subterranea]KYZ75682.1 diguanylate cyclase [Anaerosporomusa subterranea]
MANILQDTDSQGNAVMQNLSETVTLDQIFDNSYDSIWVIDRFGKVVMANRAASRMLQVDHEDIIGKNVRELVEKGVYRPSTALAAIESRTMVTGLVRTAHGLNLMSTSTPLIDENGEITMVVTNSRDKDSVDKFIATLEQERAQTNRYKSAVNYLGDFKLDNKQLIAESTAMRQILYKIGIIAKTDSTIILFGESGTGKEVIARHIHRNSPRVKEPFIPVNCAAIPNELLESEFFGYTRGAFTGANSQGKPGLFELADKGTLFLDEIGEMPLSLQSKLLRVLETGEVQRVGGTTVQKVDVRLLSATNRDLKHMVSQKSFRGDLYYRLNVIPVHIPPLRDRSEDVVALSRCFLEEFNKKYGYAKVLRQQILDVFLAYNWPGNVRELRNVIERLVLTSPTDDLDFEEEFGLSAKDSSPLSLDRNETKISYSGSLKSVLQAVEEEYIHQVLAECNGKIAEAAKKLGIHRTVLYRKVQDK